VCVVGTVGSEIGHRLKHSPPCSVDGVLQVVTSVWTLFQLYSDGYQIMWTLILLMCTMLQIRSGFIALLWIFFAIIENFSRTLLFRHWRGM
jgi:hypothetical protein